MQAVTEAPRVAADIQRSWTTRGDFVLCSHTLYYIYIPANEWLAHLERLVSWMSPAGRHCGRPSESQPRLHDHAGAFLRHRFDLGGLADAFAKHVDRYDVSTSLDQAHGETPEQSTTYRVA